MVINVLGTTDRIDVAGWFNGAKAQVERIQAGGRLLTNDRVAALVQTMSTMTQPGSSLSSLSAAQQSQLQTAISSAGQG